MLKKMMTWEKTLLATVVPLFLVSTIAMTSTPAEARDRDNRVERSDRDHKSHKRHRRGGLNTGEAIALGIGAIALGAILSDDRYNDNRYNDRYDDRYYRDRYYRHDPYMPRRRCFSEQITYRDYYGRLRTVYDYRCR